MHDAEQGFAKGTLIDVLFLRCEYEQRVGRRRIAIHGDRIECVVDELTDHRLKIGEVDFRVCKYEGEHGCHVRCNHAGALGDTGNGDITDLSADRLGIGICGHDRGRGVRDCIWSGLICQ